MPILDLASQSSQSVTCLLNGTAGSNRGQDASISLLSLFAHHGIRPRIVIANSGDEITPLARRAREQGATHVVAAGGDGTVNAVAAALIGTETPLGVLPLGTLNHFAKDLGIPLELDAAVATLFSGRVARVDVGEVNGRPFLNNSSLGLYPTIVRRREQQQNKGYGKWIAFAEAVLFALRHYAPLYVSLHVEHQRKRADASPFVFIGNNRYVASGLNIGARARLDGGRLWVYRAPHANRLGLFRLALLALLGWQDRRELATFDAAEFWVAAKRRRLSVATDGEVVTLDLPLHYRIRPRALAVIVPAGNRQ